MTTLTLGEAGLVQRAIRGWNILRLEWLARALGAAEPDAVPAGPIAELRDALHRAGPAAEPVLLDPRFGRWCTEISSLIERDAPTLLPAGRFRAACREAATFTLAARFLSRSAAADPAPPATTVRVDHAGRIRVAGTGWVLVPGIGQAGLAVTVAVCTGRFELAGAAGCGAPALAAVPALVAEREPTPLPGLISARGDPVDHDICAAEPLLMTGPPCVVIERGADDPHVPAVPGIARVPASATPGLRARHAIAAAAHLRAVIRGERLFRPGDRPTDPPPEVANLASAPQLRRLLTIHNGPGEPDSAQAEAGHLLGLLAGWLAVSDGLSAVGAELLGQLTRDGYRPQPPGATAVTPGPSGAWRAAWAQAGGTFRNGQPRLEFLPAGDAGPGPIIKALGGDGGIAVNILAAGQPRADPTIDQLSLCKARDPARYASLVTELSRPPRCLAEEIILGHQAYVEERFLAAATGYADLLLRLPHDIDLWRDLAFALRHLNAMEYCETIIFWLADVVERAEECDLELTVLGRLCPLSTRWDSSPMAMRRVTGLLEWVNHDLNHR